MAIRRALITLLLCFSLLNLNSLFHVDGKPAQAGKKTDDNIVGLNEEEYKRYVEQIRQINLDRVKKTVDDAYTAEDFDKKLAPNDEHLRTKLDEVKRQVVDKLRSLGRLRQMKQDGLPISDHEMKALNLEGVSKDVSVEDIDKMMHEKLEVLQAVDSKRKDVFKEHEMSIEAKRREKLKKMNERDRLKAEEEYKNQEKKKKEAHLRHPASKEQMEEVWEKEDEMPKDDFEPKKFFLLHDTNGDQLLDPLELEAMFYGEVKDVYSEDHDQTEMREEMSRMREHVMKEIDKNEDGVISVDEFMKYTQGTHYEDKDWEDIDQEEAYTDEEMDEYLKMYGDEEDEDGEHHQEDEHPTPEHHNQGDDGTMTLEHHDKPPASDGQAHHETVDESHGKQEHTENPTQHHDATQQHTDSPQVHHDNTPQHQQQQEQHTNPPQVHADQPSDHLTEHAGQKQEQHHDEQPSPGAHHDQQQPNDPHAM